MTELDLFRKQIDEINVQLIYLLKKRINISKEIAKLKKEKNIPIFDPEREKEIINFFIHSENSENKDYIKRFLQLIMDISKEVQTNCE